MFVNKTRGRVFESFTTSAIEISCLLVILAFIYITLLLFIGKLDTDSFPRYGCIGVSIWVSRSPIFHFLLSVQSPLGNLNCVLRWNKLYAIFLKDALASLLRCNPLPHSFGHHVSSVLEPEQPSDSTFMIYLMMSCLTWSSLDVKPKLSRLKPISKEQFRILAYLIRRFDLVPDDALHNHVAFKFCFFLTFLFQRRECTS